MRQENEDRVVPKLMISVPKWDKRNTQRIIDKSFLEKIGQE